MKQEVNINLEIASQVAKHRPEIGTVGSCLGAQFSKPQASACLPEYEKTIQEAKDGGNVALTLNRSPRKFRAITVDVISTKVTADIDNTVVILVNEGLDSEIRIPVNSDMTKAGLVTDDAIAKALKGEDTNIHFSDLDKLVKCLNILNQNEIARLTAVAADIEKAKQRIQSAIAENLNKAEKYKRERGASSDTSVLEGSESPVTIKLHE